MTKLVVVSTEELQALIADAVADGVSRVTSAQSFNRAAAADFLGHSVRTLDRRLKIGKFPEPVDGRWDRKVLEDYKRQKTK
jgi:hypothetical protein